MIVRSVTAQRISSVPLLVAVLLTGCAPASRRREPAKADVTAEPWYAPTVAQVVALHREAESLIKKRKPDEAAVRITEAQPLAAKLLAVPHPTQDAAAAASDIDDLYGRMLLQNHHYGWARLQFQKNVARWRNWTPQNEETQRRLRQAENAMAECDRQLAK